LPGQKSNLAVQLGAQVVRLLCSLTPVKAVTDTLGVARSNVVERLHGNRAIRGPQIRDGDLELAAEIRRMIDIRLTYGYRRITALLRRQRPTGSAINHKRVYRLMKKHGLLLARHTGRRLQQAHDGKVVTLHRTSALGGQQTAVPAGSGSSVC
jgi:transposase InsO family protein